jgi:hypothetical protein
MARSCFAALVLLLASLLPSLTLGANSRIAPLASPVPFAETLDLAAMVLTPIDLDELGLPASASKPVPSSPWSSR